MSVALSNRLNRNAIRGWLPPLQQIRQVLQFRPEAVPRPSDKPREEIDSELTEMNPPQTTMRQGLGLVVATALIAGLLPFIVHWIIAGRAGTALPGTTSGSLGEFLS